MKNTYSLPLLSTVLLNFLLFMVKLFVGIRTNSLCIYTDSINNLLDALSALLAFCGTLFLYKAATKKHPLGFGRLEYLLEFVMSVLITATGFSFAYNSIVRLSMPTPVWFQPRFAVVILATCFIKLGLGIFFTFRYKNTRSAIFKTLMLDSYLDTGVTAVALLSFTLSNYIGVAIDGFLGLLISIGISISGIKLILSSASKLLGESDDTMEETLRSAIQEADRRIQIEALTIIDCGTEKKLALLRLRAPKDLDKTGLQSKIKTELTQNKIQLHIEWED